MVHRWTITCCFLMKMITDVDKKKNVLIDTMNSRTG